MTPGAMTGAMRAIDAARLLSALRREDVVGSELRSLTLDRAWPWREDGVCALFLDRREAPGRREWTVLQAPDKALPGRLRRVAERGGGRWLEDLGAWVLPPTADPELPVVELLDPQAAAARLRRQPGIGDRSGRLETRLCGYKPLRRMTVEYWRCGDEPGRRWYGKALRSRDLPRVEETCARLGASAVADMLALPGGSVPDWSMLLFDSRCGTSLARLVPGPAAAHGVGLAGEALAALHGAGVELPESHSRRREGWTLDRWLGCASRSCTEMAGRLDAVRRELRRLGEAIEPGEPVPSHRDYHPGQLLVAPGGVTVLDLDTASMAEAELDVGNFLAHLDLFELDRRPTDAAELGRELCSAYEKRAGRRLESRRLLWYRAAAVLRLACVYRFRPRGAILGTLLIRRCADLLAAPATSWEVI